MFDDSTCFVGHPFKLTVCYKLLAHLHILTTVDVGY